MTHGNEAGVIRWLKQQRGKILLPHIGVLKTVDELGRENSNRKKADVLLNGKAVSLKQVEKSFLYNRASRQEFCRFLGKGEIELFDQVIQEIHKGTKKRNVSWQEIFPKKNRFKSFLRMIMMEINLSQGLSENPAELILTHPRSPTDVIDICVYNFDEFFEVFADRWITLAFRRCWTGQSSRSESTRALRLIKDPLNRPWIFDGISGSPQGWAIDAPPVSLRKTCFTCSVEVESPVKKWEELHDFRQSLIRSGFFNADSIILEKVTHKVQEKFGQLVFLKGDCRWPSVLEIAFDELQSSL
jgi:RNA polymerase-interacting CarD/CdnL/TRCF family regulator